MSRRAARREPSIYTIRANLGASASEPLLLGVLMELIKHVQYSRGQCQAPIDRTQSAYKVCIAGSGALIRMWPHAVGEAPLHQ